MSEIPARRRDPHPASAAPSAQCPVPSSSSSMHVAFLGLGAIGRLMAGHLARPPFALTVWNRPAERAARFAAEPGARHAPTPADAARDAVIVVTCLPTSPDVEALLDGPDGLLAGLAPGALLVDCTSGDPA